MIEKLIEHIFKIQKEKSNMVYVETFEMTNNLILICINPYITNIDTAIWSLTDSKKILIKDSITFSTHGLIQFLEKHGDILELEKRVFELL